jgi:PAS domain S-box-containing protein
MSGRSLQVRDTALWLRLLLVALMGAVPLFIVSLTLLKTTYGELSDFAVQEQRGNAFQRPLEQLLALLPRYQDATRRARVAGAARDDAVRELERQLDLAFASLGQSYTGEVGQSLRLDDGLAQRGLHSSRLSIVEAKWREAKTSPLADSARDTLLPQLVSSVLDLIRLSGDHSNLILDDDLDSYYLASITLTRLPEMQQRLGDVGLYAGEWLRADAAASKREQLAVMAALLGRQLEGVNRDAQTSLREDARFYGVSPSLGARLPPAVDHFTSKTWPLVRLLEQAAAGQVVGASQLERVAWEAHGESFRLWQVGSAELDQLLQRRIDAIGSKRATRSAIIVATLLLAALGMGIVIRSLLAARYSELQRNQQEIASREAQLRALGDNLPGGMTYQFLREPTGELSFAYVSAGVQRLHGLPAEAVQQNAQLLFDQFLPEDVPAMRSALADSLANATPISLTTRILRADGKVRWTQFSSAPRRLPDGRWVWDGIETDVTEQREAEEALKHTAARFAQIFNHSPIPISVNRLSDGAILDVNEEFLRISGFSREEVIGRNALELELVANPEERATLLQKMRTQGHVHGHPLQFRRRTGELRDMLLWLDLIRLGGEDCRLVIGMDVSDQKRAESQQRQLEEQLRQAQKLEALGTLAGGIAHDFNNILSAMISFAEVTLRENANNRELQTNLGEVVKAGQRASDLVRQILSFSRQTEQERTSQQLSPVVDEALGLLRVTLPANIEVQRVEGVDLPNVLASSTQIHQVIMNLGTNAAHAMRQTGGRLRVELGRYRVAQQDAEQHAELQPGEYLRLLVSDTGCGMDETTLRRIFEPFFTTKSGEGTGLGLSVVHGIVKEHGGVIVGRSNLGVGTAFSLYFPALAQATALQAPPEPVKPAGQGQRVLFIDDDPALRGMARKMLRLLGYEPVIFDSTAALLSAFQSEPHHYDALLADLAMPGVSGLELARQLLDIRPNFPIVLASGFAGKLTRADVRQLGIQDLVSKPLDFQTLARVIEQALRAGGARASAAP